MSYEQFAYVYDRLMADMPYDEWLRFAEESFAKYGKPRTIVDLGCGTGNLTIPMAERGYEMIGIDLSDDMLAVAQQKYASITWLQQDMREWEVSEQVDAVVSFCDCLNYLTEEEDWTGTFGRVFDGLKDGGLFLFDMHSIAQLESYAENQPFVFDEESISYIWTSDYDTERNEIEHALTIFATEPGTGDSLYRKFTEYHVQRAFQLSKVIGMLEGAGFSNVECFADFEWVKPTKDSGRIFVVARKMGE